MYFKVVFLVFCFTDSSSFTSVRKSTRGKKVSPEDQKEPADVLPPPSLHASSSADKDSSVSSGDTRLKVQKMKVEAADEADVSAASAGQKLQEEPPENQTEQEKQAEEEKEGRSEVEVKGQRVGDLSHNNRRFILWFH